MGRIAWVGRALTWVVLLGTAAILVVAVLVPRVGGATPYTVLTGSMRPDLPSGSLVVVRPVAPEEIGVGSVITYQLESGKPAVATHRVVAQGYDAKGDPVFRTQGDANAAPDRDWVRPVQIRGELWYSVPYLGYLNDVLTGEERQMALYGVAAFLLLYAAYMFTSSAVERDRAGRRARHRAEVDA